MTDEMTKRMLAVYQDSIKTNRQLVAVLSSLKDEVQGLRFELAEFRLKFIRDAQVTELKKDLDSKSGDIDKDLTDLIDKETG